MALLLNPYIAGNPVGGGDAFVGRIDVLREVVRTLRNPNEDALLLYGQRRIGKTSVLQELKCRLSSEGSYFPVYFDLQDQASLPFRVLLTELSICIREELSLNIPDLTEENYEAEFKNVFLPSVIEQLPEDSSVVLLFDEFDVLDHPKKEQSSAAFFPYLRQLLSSFSQRLQFVFVIGRRPDDLTNLTTSLFKATRSYPVSLLSREDCIQLIKLSEANKSLMWSDAATNKVYNLTGGHPFLTQQLCQEIWEQSHQNSQNITLKVSEKDIDDAIPATLSGARQALEWLWGGLNPAERIVAAALAEAGARPINRTELESILQKSGVRILIGELQNAPQVLEDWDLIQEKTDGFEFRVELLRRWVADRKPLSREQEEIDKIQPLAETFFQTAYGIYSVGELDEAIPLLKKAIGFNPNHLRASQLLSEIFLAQS
ncbi:MAG: ATP-binding protein, partial [Cyanobacteria bacterium J06649_4]